MSNIPEGVETATAEGRDVREAVGQIAETLGVKPHQIKHKIDMSHFRTPEGGVKPMDTVKLIGWVDADAPEEAPEPSSSRPSKRSSEPKGRRDGDRKRGDDRPRKDRPPRDDGPKFRGAEDGETDASNFAKEWFEVVLEHLRVEGTVEASGSDERVHVRIVPTAKAGRLIGRRGSTLAAIRHLLGLALEQFGSFTIDVDVDDDRGGSKSRDSGDRRRDDRKERSRGSDRRGRNEDRGSGFPEDKLRALARRAAEKAIDSGKTFTINLELNSYDRRIVHVEVSDIEGVTTKSVVKDGKKVVQVLPE